MKPEHIYDQRQSAARMESVMIIASVIGAVSAILVLFRYGWLPGFAFFMLSLVAYAFSRVFDLLADLLLAQNAPRREMPEVKAVVKEA